MKYTGALLEVILPITAEDRARDFHSSALFGAAADPTSTSVIDLRDAHGFWTQGSNNCVEVSHLTPVHDLASMRGKPLPRIGSPGNLFQRTQIRQGLIVPGVGLPNTGSACGWALAELKDVGAVANDSVPDTVEVATRVPTLAEEELPIEFRITGAHRINFEDKPTIEAKVATLTTGLSAVMQLARITKAAMPNGCMLVDDAYGNLPEGAVYGTAGFMPGGKVWGGHSQQIVYVDLVRGVIGFATSWGGTRVFEVSLAWFATNGGGVFVVEDYLQVAS